MVEVFKSFVGRKKSAFNFAHAPDKEKLKGRTLFIGLGAMKSGTSWVSDFLRKHPQVYHSDVKEINFWNQLDKNTLQSSGPEFRLIRMKNIILENGTNFPPTLKQWRNLQSLAEIDNITSSDDYENYFARRIGNEGVFGEICPQYSLLPPETYRKIESLGYNTRLLFFMRDPTERLASNIQHVLRRKNYNIDQLIENLTENHPMWQRSDYSITLDAYRQSSVGTPLKTFIYEDLFSSFDLSDLCDFLGIRVAKANFDQRINAARGVEVTEKQKQRLRDKLNPIYVKLANYLDKKPESWRW